MWGPEDTNGYCPTTVSIFEGMIQGPSVIQSLDVFSPSYKATLPLMTSYNYYDLGPLSELPLCSKLESGVSDLCTPYPILL